MHIGQHAEKYPDKPAVLMAGSGESVSFRELDARSNRLAQLLRAHGIEVGGHIAVLLDNQPRYHEVCWAALRSGIYFTPINWHLGSEEASYIVRDCGAQALITSARFADLMGQMRVAVEGLPLRLAIDGDIPGFVSYEDALATQSPEPVPDETEGAWMFYSSGTTGRPKGIQ